MKGCSLLPVNLAETTLLISTVKYKQWAPYWVRGLETQAVLMATWISPGNFPLPHSLSPSLLGHMSIMPQERGQEQEGANLEDPQGNSKQKNSMFHFQDLKQKYCFCSFPAAFPQYFPPLCDGEFMGSLSCWAQREAVSKRGTWVGVKQLQWKVVMISSTRPKHDVAAIMRGSWHLVPSSDLSSVAFPDLKLGLSSLAHKPLPAWIQPWVTGEDPLAEHWWRMACPSPSS